MSYLKATIMIVFLALIAIYPVLGADYVGSEVCGNCHKEIYIFWKESAHSKALIKAEDAFKAGYPLPKGTESGDLQYTFMGKNLVVWINKTGHLVQEQYIVEKKEWKTNVYEEEMDFTCAICHTTGYEPKGTEFTGSNPFQSGTWKFDGVGCERCHGPGSDHIAGSSKVNIRKDNSSELCGQCHSQKTVNGLDPYRRYRNQYNDLTQSKHYAATPCIKCHNAHDTTDRQYSSILSKYDAELYAAVKPPIMSYYKGSDGRSFTIDYEALNSTEALCKRCHASIEIKHYVADCLDCHMAKSRKLAYQWDQRTHTFRSDDGFNYNVSPVKNYPKLTCNPCHKSEIILHPTSQVHNLLLIVPTPTPSPTQKSTPGFEAAMAIASVMILYFVRRRPG